MHGMPDFIDRLGFCLTQLAIFRKGFLLKKTVDFISGFQKIAVRVPGLLMW